MPRPGPRPYECVRRAWHSERHQPIRGSIIQQIFRVVHETHSSQTKKNKEWQEKVPIVVLKTEEILYSKANSEDEYMKLDTLWDRINDAINTIIRRDDSTETGELLPPCVEAALNLGCIPVRASRSQRHSHLRTYLNLRPQEPASLPPKIVDKTIEKQCPNFSPLHSGNQFNCARSSMNLNSTLLFPESSCQVTRNDNLAPPCYPSFDENIPSGHSKMMRVEVNVPLKLGAVYPLYYGTQFQNEDPKSGSRIPENLNSTATFVGKHVGTSIPEPVEMGAFPHLFSCPGSDIASNPTTKPDFHYFQKRPPIRECDLSLQLGLLGEPSMSLDRSSAREMEDVGGSINSQEGNRLRDLSSERNKEFCFFPEKTADYPHESCSSKWISENECRNLEASIRKPRALFSDNLEDVQFCWHPDLLPSNQFTGQVRGPGL